MDHIIDANPDFSYGPSVDAAPVGDHSDDETFSPVLPTQSVSDIIRDEPDDPPVDPRHSDRTNINQPSIFAGFATASGKNIPVSRSAIEKAKNLFQSLDDEENDTGRKSRIFRAESADEETALNRSTAAGKGALREQNKDLDDSSISDVPIRQNGCRTVGFATASGKAVHVSAKALKKAKELFEQVDIEADEKTQTPSPDTLQSRQSEMMSGNADPVPQKTLPNAQKLIEHKDQRQNRPQPDQPPAGFVGFATAAGRTIPVSEKAVQAAKKLFKDVDQDLGLEQPNGDTLFGGETIPVSEKVVETAEKLFKDLGQDRGLEQPNRDTFAGFATAAGKTIKVSEKAVETAKKLFKDVDQDLGLEKPNRNTFAGFATAAGKTIPVSEKSVQAAKELFKDVDEDLGLEQPNRETFAGSATAAGKTIQVSEKAVETAEKLFTDVDKGLGLEQPNQGTLAGFATAAGKTIPVSKKAVETAKKLFKDVDKDLGLQQPNQGTFAGFATAAGKTIKVSKKAVQAAKKLFKDVDQDLGLEQPSQDAFPKLSTAAGKTIPVSEEALQTAKKLFEDVDLDRDPSDCDSRLVGEAEVPCATPESELSASSSFSDKPWLSQNTDRDKDNELAAKSGEAMRQDVGEKKRGQPDFELASMELENIALEFENESLMEPIEGSRKREASSDASSLEHTSGKKPRMEDSAHDSVESTNLCSTFSGLCTGGVEKVGPIFVEIVRQYPVVYANFDQQGSLRSFVNEKVFERSSPSCGDDSFKDKLYEEVEQRVKTKLALTLPLPNAQGRSVREKDIKLLVSGEEIFHAIHAISVDTSELQFLLSPSQLEALRQFECQQFDMIQAEFTREVSKRLSEKASDPAGGKDTAGRKGRVAPLLRLKVVNLLNVSFAETACITLWRPNKQLSEYLVENGRFAVHGLVASCVRNHEVQFRSTKSTRFQELDSSPIQPPLLDEHFIVPWRRRICDIDNIVSTNSDSTAFQPVFDELDIVGIVVSSQSFQSDKNPFEIIYLCDTMINFVAVQFWGSVQAAGFDKSLLLQPSSDLKMVYFKNLQWRSASSHGHSASASIPCLYVSENTLISTNPRDAFVDQLMQDMRNEILDQNCQSFLMEARSNLSNLLRSHLPMTKSMPVSAFTPETRRSIPSTSAQIMNRGCLSAPSLRQRDLSLTPGCVQVVQGSPAHLQSIRNRQKLMELYKYGDPPDLKVTPVTRQSRSSRLFKARPFKIPFKNE